MVPTGISYTPTPLTRPPITVPPATAPTTAVPVTKPLVYSNMGTPAGFTDIRSQLVTPPTSGLQSQATGMLGRALTGLAGASQLPAYQPVAGPNFGQANQYLGQAAGAAGAVNLGSIGAQSVQAQNVGTVNVADPNFQKAMAMLQQALAASSSPESAQLRQTLMGQFSGLSTAPDRLALAAQALSLQRQATDPAWRNDLRTVGQSAAALGRIGAGMTTTELDDVTLAREKALGLYGQQLANDAAGQTLQDRLNVFGAGQGLQGQFSGQDLSQANLRAGLGGQYAGMATATTANQQQNAGRQLQAGMANQSANLSAATGNADRSLSAAQARASLGLQQAGLYAGLGGQSASMASTSAGFAADQAARARQAQMDQAALQQQLVGSLAGVQGQQFGQGMQAAGLQTQQQQWQNQLQQQAVQNQVQQQQLQDQLLNSQFGRQLSTAQAQGSLGYGNDPYGLQLSGSQYQQQQATAQQQGLAQLAQQQALQQALAARGASGMGLPTLQPPATLPQPPYQMPLRSGVMY